MPGSNSCSVLQLAKEFLLGFGGSGPLLHPRQLVVIHDASVFRHPEFYSAHYGLWHRAIGRLLSRRARIATVSEFSKHELAEVLKLDAATIPIFHNGSEHLQRVPLRFEILEELKLDARNYFVALGNLTPNKNLALAVEALEQVPDAFLIVVGSVNERVFGDNLSKRAGDRLIFAGRLDDGRVRGLLGSAAALLFPSLYEGFGIPPLEAMVNGCPVIASDIPPVREVCGDAALYFDPHRAEELAAGMRTILAEGETVRQERVRRGSERAASFTWDRSAQRAGAVLPKRIASDCIGAQVMRLAPFAGQCLQNSNVESARRKAPNRFNGEPWIEVREASAPGAERRQSGKRTSVHRRIVPTYPR